LPAAGAKGISFWPAQPALLRVPDADLAVTFIDFDAKLIDYSACIA
jgi:hypothetical protein